MTGLTEVSQDAVNAGPVVVNICTGKRGSYDDWVAAFGECWAHGGTNLDSFLEILAPDIVLKAPGLRPTSGHAAARRAFARVFSIWPDLTATVHRWAVRDNTLFIEMTFSATIGGRPVVWDNVDRFFFRDGTAVERVAYFDPTPIRRAYLGSFRGVVQLIRLRLGNRILTRQDYGNTRN
jgi:ketosteroid isomerase-like protein